jgi:hypothetical protein
VVGCAALSLLTRPQKKSNVTTRQTGKSHDSAAHLVIIRLTTAIQTKQEAQGKRESKELNNALESLRVGQGTLDLLGGGKQQHERTGCEKPLNGECTGRWGCQVMLAPRYMVERTSMEERVSFGSAFVGKTIWSPSTVQPRCQSGKQG